MRLRQPTDFLVLKALESHGRNVATNLATHTEKSRKNINTRLPVLEDYGLVSKVGPAERSGLYEITSKGKAALVYRNRYGEVDDFEELIEGPDARATVEAREAEAGFVRGDDENDGDDEE